MTDTDFLLKEALVFYLKDFKKFQIKYNKHPYFNGSYENFFIIENLLWVFTPNICLEDTEQWFQVNFTDEELIAIKITNKNFIDTLFSRNYTNNLLEIYISGENWFEFIPEDWLYGSHLNYSTEYEIIQKTNQIKIINCKFQPVDSDSTISLTSSNIVEFDSKTKLLELNKQIYTLSRMVLELGIKELLTEK